MAALLRALLCALALPAALCMYADQLGQRDWLLENVGVPSQLAYSAKRLVVATHGGMLASLHSRTGKIAWRHLLAERDVVWPASDMTSGGEDGRQAGMHLVRGADGSEAVVTVAASGKRLRSWRLSDGGLLWDKAFAGGKSKHGVDSALLLGGKQVAVLSGGVLAVYDVASGKMKTRLTQENLTSGKGASLGNKPYQLTRVFASPNGGVVVAGTVGPLTEAAMFCSVDIATGTTDRQVLSLPRAMAHGQGGVVFGRALDGQLVAIASVAAEPKIYLAKAGDSKFSSMDLSPILKAQAMVGPARVVQGSEGRLLSLLLDSGGQAVVAVPSPQQRIALIATVPSGTTLGATVGSDGQLYLSTVWAGEGGEGATLSTRHLLVLDDGSTTNVGGGEGDAHEEQVERGAMGSGSITGLLPFAVDKHGGGGMVRDIVLTSHGAVALVQPGKGVAWVRDEALASIKQVQFVDRVVHESLPSSNRGTKLPSFSERLDMHWAIFTSTLSYANELLSQAVGQSGLGTHRPTMDGMRGLDDGVVAIGNDGFTSTMRHKFGLDKVAVCLSTPVSEDSEPMVVGLALDSGRVLWRSGVPRLSGAPVKLIQSRPKHVGATNPEVMAVSFTDGVSQVAYVDGATGQVDAGAVLPLTMASVVPLPAVDRDFRTVHLLVGHAADNTPKACLLSDSPSARAAVERLAGKVFFHMLDQSVGTMESRLLTSGSLHMLDGHACYDSIQVARTVLAEEHETIAAVAYPTPGDVVNSPAQILGDDSLLLKYLNPNLAVVLSHSTSNFTLSSSTLYLSLVDTVAGRVLHRVSHPNARPVTSASPVVMSENWVMYYYWNTKAKRTEIGVMSLFEGMIDKYHLNPFRVPSQDGNFSSFKSPPPVVMQRTFVFPRAVSALQATVTAQGISTKNLLVAMESGQVAQLHRRMLDPRRPNKEPSKTEKMEGLMQYFTFLFPPPITMVTANRTVVGLEKIHATPAVIESTTLVLATGVDVFFMRTAPSKSFDLLAAEFNRPMLLALLVGLTTATVLASRLERKKRLAGAWK